MSFVIPENVRGDIARSGEVLTSRRTWCQAVHQFMAVLPDKPVVIHLSRNRVNLMTAMLAVSASGGRNLLPPDNKRTTVQWLRSQYPGAVTVGEPGKQQDNSSEETSMDIAVADKITNTSSPAKGIALHLDVEAEAVVAHTSGSSGTPKAVFKTWKSVHQTALSTIERLLHPLTKDAVELVATVPAQHMYGLETTIMIALMGKGILQPGKPFFPADIARHLAATQHPAVLITTPIHLVACLRSGVTFPTVARIISATAPLDVTLAKEVETRFGCELWEIYGCTEGGSLATRHTAEEISWSMLPRFTLSALNSQAQVMSPGFAAPIILPDRIEVISETQFNLLGRDDDLINIGGKRGSLAGLEAQLLNIPGVEDAKLVEDNHRLKGLVVSSKLSKREVLAQFARQVDPVFVPRLLKIVARIPRNDTGKIIREEMLRLLKGETN